MLKKMKKTKVETALFTISFGDVRLSGQQRVCQSGMFGQQENDVITVKKKKRGGLD